MTILESTKCNVKNGNYDNLIAVDEYNGAYSIASVTESQEGKIYPRWVYPQVAKDTPGEKVFPLSVRLGDKATAVKILRGMADVIEGGQHDTQGGSAPPSSGNSDDIPF